MQVILDSSFARRGSALYGAGRKESSGTGLDDTAPNFRNSFVGRNVDQTNYHLRNSATDLTIPKPKREFLKRSFKYSGAML